MLISNLNLIVKVIFIGVVYLILMFSLRIMFKDTRKTNKSHEGVYEGPNFHEDDTIIPNMENTTIIEHEDDNTRIFHKDYGESKDDYYEHYTEEQEEAVYSPLIDKLISIWERMESIYIGQIKRKKIVSDIKSINREKRKCYNRIIYSPIEGKIYNSYYNYVFMNLILMLLVTLIFILLFLIELQFPFKLLGIIPGAVFFLYMCKMYNYLSPFISRIKVLRRHIIYINKENISNYVISPVEGVISALKEDENSIEIKTSFGIRIFIAVKYIKSIEMCVDEGDKVSLGEELFKITLDEQKSNPVMFFYIGSNRSYKISNIRQINNGWINTRKALFVTECSINETSHILKNGEVISLSSYSYGDNEYSGKIVAVNSHEHGGLVENSNYMGREERFLVIVNSDSTISLKSLYTDKYVRVDVDRKGRLLADSIEISKAEKFIFIWHDPKAYSMISLSNNKIVSGDINSEGELYANKDYISIAEKFFVWKH